MPYIKQSDRQVYAELIKQIQQYDLHEPGELAYLLYSILLQASKDGGESYHNFALISGVVTETLAEFRRRVVIPYERTKKLKNGDVKYIPQSEFGRSVL